MACTCLRSPQDRMLSHLSTTSRYILCAALHHPLGGSWDRGCVSTPYPSCINLFSIIRLGKVKSRGTTRSWSSTMWKQASLQRSGTCPPCPPTSLDTCRVCPSMECPTLTCARTATLTTVNWMPWSATEASLQIRWPSSLALAMWPCPPCRPITPCTCSSSLRPLHQMGSSCTTEEMAMTS